ncbi:MAG: DUF411 domain-containing protein [Thiotrichaceae bacterium]|nr:DUF411 domain-containing protein [Thiotrichaceae bacterium]
MKLLKLLTILSFFCSSSGFAESPWDKVSEQQDKPIDIVVYRSPTCGCCSKWLAHLEKHQFNVEDIVTNDVESIKEKYAVPKNLASCHTAIVDGYVIEGHVPAADIKTLLKTKPKIIGLTVPGMPAGTPGMEMGGRKDPFKVMAFDKEGNKQIFNRYENY